MAVNQNNVISLSAATTNIPIASYVQIAATTPISSTKLVLTNTTASIVKLAYGSAGNETDLVAVAPSASVVLDVGLNVIPVGSRLALEAVGAAATTGYFTVSLLP